MLAVVHAATLHGVQGVPVSVEAHVTDGLPCLRVVGHADPVCREARDRVRAAMLSSGLAFPSRKVTVNLAPSSQRKVGPPLDLAIALALLGATAQLPPGALEGVAALGELGLDGSLRPVRGMVPLAAAVRARALVAPSAQAVEAGLCGPTDLRPAATLAQVVAALRGEAAWPPLPAPAPATAPPAGPDMADVRGQALARAALEVAAAGGHHLLLVGPPGAGKTMLAERLVGLLPDLSPDEAVEVTSIHSAAGRLDAGQGLLRRPQYHAPHQTASAPAILGGGSGGHLQPGAISCAHRGVLFLDELGEFPKSVLDALRQPLEEGVVRVHRAGAWASFPARVLLVGAMNPCPCGEGGIPGRCRCGPTDRARYLRRLSSPLLDRFDLRVQIGRPDAGEVVRGGPAEPTAAVAERVGRARRRAAERGVAANAAIPTAALDRLAPLRPEAAAALEEQLRRGRLSARGLHRLRRVALTLADLSGEEPPLGPHHVAQAQTLRAEALVGEAAA